MIFLRSPLWPAVLAFFIPGTPLAGIHFTNMYLGRRDTRLPRSSQPTTLKAPHITSSSGRLAMNSGMPPVPSPFNCSVQQDTISEEDKLMRDESHVIVSVHHKLIGRIGGVSESGPTDSRSIRGDPVPCVLHFVVNYQFLISRDNREDQHIISSHHLSSPSHHTAHLISTHGNAHHTGLTAITP